MRGEVQKLRQREVAEEFLGFQNDLDAEDD